MTFESRTDAGQQLGEYLHDREVEAELVLGLPRGGVVVAAEVARSLHAPLDVLVVRKIGHPLFREFAVGALAEGDVVVLDEAALLRSSFHPEDLHAIIQEERARLQAYQEKFAPATRRPLAGALVVLVDDGLATGATLEAAVRSARNQQARKIVVAVPVASTSGAARIEEQCDEFHAIRVESGFQAVGQSYQCFDQVSDDEVRQILNG